MKTTLARINFAAPTRPASRPLSPGEALIAAGVCFQLDASGTLLVHSRLVIGVFIGTTAIITTCSLGDAEARDAREQFVGFLAGSGYEIVRVRLRFPVAWVNGHPHAPPQVLKQCIVHWCRIYSGSAIWRYPLLPPSNVLAPLATRAAIKDGARFFKGLLAILRELEKTDPELLMVMTPEIWRLARWWEIQIGKLEKRSELQDYPEAGDRQIIAEFDRHWKSCLQYFPGYDMLPQTLCRLL